MPHNLNRRTFGKQLTVAAVATAPLAVVVAARQAADEPAAKNAENDGEKNEPKDAADLLLEIVRQRYPKNLDDARLAEIREQIVVQQQRSKVLGSFPLTNADEPAPVFAAWRAEG